MPERQVNNMNRIENLVDLDKLNELKVSELKKLNKLLGKKVEEKKEAPVQAAPAPVAAAEDDAELVAVIAAAIAAAEGTSTDGFVVRSIKRRKSNRWN